MRKSKGVPDRLFSREEFEALVSPEWTNGLYGEVLDFSRSCDLPFLPEEGNETDLMELVSAMISSGMGLEGYPYVGRFAIRLKEMEDRK